MSLLARLRDKLPAAKPIVREGATTRVDQAALRGNVDLIRKAVAALPNTSALFPTRESYRDLGYAIKAALPDSPDEAFDIFAAWCGRWTNGVNDPDIVEADWRRMKPPFRRGASWLYELATLHGGGKFDRAEQWFVPPVEPLFAIGDTAETPARKFKLTLLADAAKLALTDQAKPLVKGLLDQGAMSVIYGDSNTGKTFVALDIGHHIATGAPWAGLKTARKAVVYVAAEGGRGINKRAAALVAKYGAAEFYIVNESVDLFSPDADLRPLIRDISAAGAVGLVVLDTLARVMAGGDENATKDMGFFVRNVDTLRRATDAHVLLIHHTGKDASKGARGSSALRAATDTEIEVFDDRLAVTKQRDLDKSLSFAFRLNIVELGKDDDGDPITSGTITVERDNVAAPEGAKARSLTAVEASIYRALEKALNVTEQDCVAVGDLLDLSGKALSKLKPDTVRVHLRSMMGKGFVTRPRSGVWALAAKRPADYFETPASTIFD